MTVSRPLAEFSVVPSENWMPPRARMSPATSSVASGCEVPTPTLPSAVTLTRSCSLPEKTSPGLSVRSPEVDVSWPSAPSCVATVTARSFSL